MMTVSSQGQILKVAWHEPGTLPLRGLLASVRSYLSSTYFSDLPLPSSSVIFYLSVSLLILHLAVSLCRG